MSQIARENNNNLTRIKRLRMVTLLCPFLALALRTSGLFSGNGLLIALLVLLALSFGSFFWARTLLPNDNKMISQNLMLIFSLVITCVLSVYVFMN